jgi:hypothetical protein
VTDGPGSAEACEPRSNGLPPISPKNRQEVGTRLIPFPAEDLERIRTNGDQHLNKRGGALRQQRNRIRRKWKAISLQRRPTRIRMESEMKYSARQKAPEKRNRPRPHLTGVNDCCSTTVRGKP